MDANETEDKLDPAAAIEQIDSRTTKTLGDARILIAITSTILFSLFGLVGGTMTAYGQVRDTAKDAAKEEAREQLKAVAGLPIRVDGIENAQKATNAVLKDVQVEMVGVREDLRFVFPRLPPVQRDGGQ